MPSLTHQIEEDLTAAMKRGDQTTRDTLRMLKTALINRQIDKGGELTEDDLIAILRKEAKSRQEAMEQYRRAGRSEQAEKEANEKKIIEQYLPAEMTDQELTKIIEEAISATGAREAKDMGKVMREVMTKVGGRVDGSKVAALVRSKLS